MRAPAFQQRGKIVQMVMSTTDDEARDGDRRRWDRYAPDVETSVTLASGGQTFDCALLDLSLGGARLRVVEDLPDDGSVVLQHPVAGLFFACQTWRQGGEIGIRFRIPAQTREHALQCAAVLLYDDDETRREAPHSGEDARAAR